jgi:GntR family transcriptional regulator
MPVYRQVADTIRHRIDEGRYAPGSQLPSERDLGEEFEISRVTVRQAVSLLRAQGVVVAEHGRGVFVARPRQVTRLARSRLSRTARQENQSAFFGDATTAGFTPSVAVRVSFEAADARVAGLLEVAEGAELTVRTRVMSADGTAVQLATSRLPRDVTRGTAIEDVDTGSGGLYARLEESGHRLDRFAEYVGCRMPDADAGRTAAAPVAARAAGTHRDPGRARGSARRGERHGAGRGPLRVVLRVAIGLTSGGPSNHRARLRWTQVRLRRPRVPDSSAAAVAYDGGCAAAGQ